jgi:glutamine amidotransferase
VIVDYGMGNLFSVRQACRREGLDALITSEPRDLQGADLLILPGIGAFGEAMATLDELGLSDAVREHVRSGRTTLGVCLGMQLLMERSHEFGVRTGLGILRGEVVRFDSPEEGGRRLKVPQVQWNSVRRARPGGPDVWMGTPLAGLSDGEYFYFVHSYHVRPADDSVTVATARYGGIEFCAAVAHKNVFACQFHPERSGPAGLRVYRNLAGLVRGR